MSDYNDIAITNLGQLRIGQYNVGGGKKLQTFLLNPDVWDYDIWAIQEPTQVKRGEDFTSFCTKRGAFHLEYQNSQHTRVSFYINKRLPVDRWDVTFVSTDISFLRLQLQGTNATENLSLYIFNVYNPVPASTSSRGGVSSIPLLREAIDGIDGDRHHILILGDFNLHHPLWGGRHTLGTHNWSSILIDSMEERGLELANVQGTATRTCRDNKTTIDLTWASTAALDILTEWRIADELDIGSDHLPIAVKLDLAIESLPPKATRNWKLLDNDKFLSSLAASYPRPIQLNTSDEIDAYCDSIHASLAEAIDSSVPWRKIKLPSEFPMRREAKAWWDANCKDACDDVKESRRRLLRNATNPPGAWHTHQQLVNLKSRTIRRAKAKGWRDFVAKLSESNNLWGMTKWARNDSTKPVETPRFPTITKGEGAGRVQASTWDGKVELLREKFYPAPEHADLTDIEPPDPNRRQLPSSRLFTQAEVRRAIMKPANTSPGRSGISNQALKASLPLYLKVYTVLFNACARLSYHPKAFKVAETVVLRKPNKLAGDVGAYRPIALLDVLGKAMERLISKRMQDLAEAHGLLPEQQMGGRRHRDTGAALELLTEQIHTVWSKGTDWVASVLSLDMAGAYDHAVHSRLLSILRQKGLPEWMVEWTQSFLTDRQTTLRLGSYTSELFPVLHGIPQGSPISPILFLFYNSELVDEPNNLAMNASTGGFVDDVNILVYSKSVGENNRLLSRLHSRALNWANRHGAKFNPKKYELLHCSRATKKHDLSIPLQLEGLTIDAKPEIRVLGVQLDSKLQWHQHIKKVETKIESSMRALTSLTASTWGVTFGKARHVYQAVVVPAITFGSMVWHTPASVKGSRKWVAAKCQVIQNKGLRSIGGCFKSTPVPILHKEMHIPPIELKLSSLRAAYCGRRNAARLDRVILRAREKIARRLNIRRTRAGTLPETPGQRTDKWYKDTYQRKYKLAEYPDLGFDDWAYPASSEEAATFIDVNGIKTYAKSLMMDKWSADWETYREQNQSFVNNTVCGAAPLETQDEVLARHRGLAKQQSTLAIHMRTEINGFRAYLYKRRVPGIDSPYCVPCQLLEGRDRRENARHVTQFCVRGLDDGRRAMWRKAGDDNWRRFLTNAKGLDAATRWLLMIGGLEQFSLAAKWLGEEQEQEQGQEPEQAEDDESWVELVD